MSASLTTRGVLRQAERAFFHRSVLSLLYFPGEHKLAVYMPLCAPLGTAVLVRAVHQPGDLNLVSQW
jgi:phosphatidylinositol glycan class S